MGKKIILLLGIFFLSVIVFVPTKAVQAAEQCLCLIKFGNDPSKLQCVDAVDEDSCKNLPTTLTTFTSCNFYQSPAACQSVISDVKTALDNTKSKTCFCLSKDLSRASCEFASNVYDCFNKGENSTLFYGCNNLASDTNQICQTRVDGYDSRHPDSSYLKNRTTVVSAGTASAQKTYEPVSRFIPGCVDEVIGKDFLSSSCGSITVFFDLAFSIITYLFGIIGGIALLYFIYGGFILILSQGNSEKVEQGKAVIMAAVLGILIAFGGYALIQFVGSVAGISQEYKLR
jgi:hypothetical protein